MARKLISEADVHATADALVAEGKEPTILAIYSVLGCGSYSTISKYKKTWKKQNGDVPEHIQLKADLQTPEEILKVAESFAQKLWVQAKEREQAILESEHNALSLEKAEMNERAEEIIERSEQTRVQLEDLQAEMEHLTLQHEKALASNRELSHELDLKSI